MSAWDPAPGTCAWDPGGGGAGTCAICYNNYVTTSDQVQLITSIIYKIFKVKTIKLELNFKA